MAVFAGRRIDLQGLERAPGKTFRWGGEYSYNLNSRETLFTELNVFESFQPEAARVLQARRTSSSSATCTRRCS